MGFSTSELGQVLDASAFIFEQAAYFGLQPAKFHFQLQQVDISETKVFFSFLFFSFFLYLYLIREISFIYFINNNFHEIFLI